MNTTRWTFLLLLTGCSAAPPSNDAATPDAPADALTCGRGQVPGYRAGCANPAPFCVPDEITDALALTYCGCDGANFTWNAATPQRPWSHAGPCVVDGGATDAPTTDTPTIDTPTIDTPTTDAPVVVDATDGGARDGSLDAPARDALTCGAGHVAGYDQGCVSPVPHCADDTSGDAVALVFCGCDGTTFSTNQSPPLRPWSHWGACTPDGGVDAVAIDLPSPDAPAVDAPAIDAAACPLPPIDTASCARDSDCTTVARGCYCGRLPVVGVARAYAAAVGRCEEEAASRCALGCPVMEGSVAQDGRSPADGGVIAVRCEPQTSGVGSCRSYVP